MRPPAFAIAQARAAGINLALVAEACDADEQPAKCCAADRLIEKPTCCAERHVSARSEESNRSGEDDQVIGWRALACRGQTIHWLAAVPTLIMSAQELLNEPALVERRAPAVSETAISVPDAPDVPPPEVASLA